jgi:UDP-N-acetylmuramate dehydrogenase
MSQSYLIAQLIAEMPAVCSLGSNSAIFSYWKIGGPVGLLVEPSSVEQLSRAIALINQYHDTPSIVVGDGSNLLFDSKGFEGVIVKIGNAMSTITIDGNRATCEAGVWVPKLAYKLSNKGLTGVEHICGIPGRIGGLIYMNGGSNRRSILENTISVDLINIKGEIETEYVSNLSFAYRMSPFQGDGRIVARAVLQLEESDRKHVKNSMRKILESRRKKFPRKLPNCGSVFLSDPAMYETIGPPGYAIEKVGLKGTKQGGAEISPLHANFIVNNGNASSNDVLYLIYLARKRVYDDTGFLMDCEARYISPSGQMLQAHVEADKRWRITE